MQPNRRTRSAIALVAVAAVGAFLLAFGVGKASKTGDAERAAPARLAAALAPESDPVSTDVAIGDDLPALPEMRKPKPRRERPARRAEPAGTRPDTQERVPTPPTVQPTTRPRTVAPVPRTTAPQVKPRSTTPNRTQRKSGKSEETIKGGSVN